MTGFPPARALRRILAVTVCLCASAPAAGAQGWSSPLLGRELVLIEKTVSGDRSPARPLPEAVQEKLGPDFVDYESFVAARLPADAAKELTAVALREGRSVLLDSHPPAVLPFHSFHPEISEERTANWRGRRLEPAPVPGLFLIRFAFPLRAEWLDVLRDCGVDPVLYYGNGMYLTRTRHLGVLRSCRPAARFLAWADAFRSTDRLSPELLERAGLELKPYSLVFAPGTALETALAELPKIVETGGHMSWDDGTLSLSVRAGAPELEALVRTSLHLLSVHEAESEPEPSDERQGQIVAGNYVGYPGVIAGAVTTPGYLTWLANRGLRTPANQQTVAVFDTGYDDGSGPTGDHHPALENPERLIATEAEACFVFNRTLPIDDTRGHGTAVAGIIAGNGATGLKDAQGFELGTGIAPDVKLVAVQVIDSELDCSVRGGFGNPPDNIGNAITFSRVTTTGADKALIANHSWNLPLDNYSSMAKLFDQRVIDGAPATSGSQAMTMVVSAGNGGPGVDTILSPATAKNAITVGSAQNYRPSYHAGAPAGPCTNPNDFSFAQEADNIAAVNNLSSIGADFRPFSEPVIPPLVTNVRVKPDLVANGGRVAMIVPDQSDATYTCPALCHKYSPAGTSFSLGSGTSFAAPVVTGVAAHARKWFMDRGVQQPAPSLIKGKLIATATDLGPATGDYRPSNRTGWGRVDLNRATDPAVTRFYVNENDWITLTTGASIDWQRTIDNYLKPVFIVLVWSDPAPTVSTTTSQVPLVNDLQLTVEMVGANVYWRGNNFNENIDGNDNGDSFPTLSAARPSSTTP